MIIDHIQQNEAWKRGLKPVINLEQMSPEVQNRYFGLLFECNPKKYKNNLLIKVELCVRK